ncbi:MAG: hypothetical protein KDI19_13715, partial [Pseudomonadales bacterium]|nr:hypothetical protein [Pseudomonadales bacterium]
GSRHEQQLAVTGDIGKIETAVPGDELYVSNRKRGGHVVVPVRQDPRVREQGFHHGASYLEHLGFIDAIQSGKPAAVTTRDGLRSVAIGLAAQASIDSGLPILMRPGSRFD